MDFQIQVLHRHGWSAWRVKGRPLVCTDRGTARDALLDVIGAGEAAARAVGNGCTEIVACLDPDGEVTISGRRGWARAPVSSARQSA